MFEEILKLVKQQIGNNPDVAGAIPQEEAGAVHHEVASHIENGLREQVAAQGGLGNLLSGLSGDPVGNPAVSSINGGLISGLGNKFGLPPAVTSAIAAAIPGILQKFAHKTNDPNDNSLTIDNIMKSLGGLGGLF